MVDSYFGAAVGRGAVNCALVETDDGRVIGRQVRTIDPGPYRFGRRGDLVSSGFDLLVTHADRSVAGSAVAVRTRRDLFAARCGAKGRVRGAEVVPHTDAVLRALGESGAIERYDTTLIADIGVAESHVYTVADGEVVADRRSRAVVLDDADAGRGAPLAAADFLQSAIDREARKPQAFVLIGSGAQFAGILEALSDVARAAGAEAVPIEEPEAIAATGAALLAADRRAGGGGAAPNRLGTGIGAFGGSSVRATAAVLPVLVLAALTVAVLAAGYATGIIGPAGESTEQAPPSPTYASASDVLPQTGNRLPATSTTLRPAETRVPSPSPRDLPERATTPVMTTFAPAPTTTAVAPMTPRPAPTTTAPPSPNPPRSLLPTRILPWPPTDATTAPPSGGTLPGTPAPGATQTPSPGPSTGTAEPAPPQVPAAGSESTSTPRPGIAAPGAPATAETAPAA